MSTITQIDDLIYQNKSTGIETIYIGGDNKSLYVVFITHENDPQAKEILGSVDKVTLQSEIDINGKKAPSINNSQWVKQGNRDVLRVDLTNELSFIPYKLVINHKNLHYNFSEIRFSNTPDRIQELINQNQLTGIDFVYVHKKQVKLDVYFFTHKKVPRANTILGNISPTQIQIYCAESISSQHEIPVEKCEWKVMDGRNVLRIHTKKDRKDFKQYRLKINHSNIDSYYNDVLFNFKVNCYSSVDCRKEICICPPLDQVDFPVDYLARDFDSFRRALLDFAHQRYPDWKDRLEADIGVMLVEIMSALGDELAYYQDRIAREAYLETASQRRSIRHHARLVDYEMDNGRGAKTWLEVMVKPNQVGTVSLPAGGDVWALSDKGNRLSYEIGSGLSDILSEHTYTVNAACNVIYPHIWDEDDTCLPIGTTELYLKGKHKGNLTHPSGKWVLLCTEPVDRSKPKRRWLIRITNIEETKDSILSGLDITHITWDSSQALPFEVDLTESTIHGNLVPITAGRVVENRFVIGVNPSSLKLPDKENTRNLKRALERKGSNGSVIYLFSLIDPELTEEDSGKEEARAFVSDLEKPQSKVLSWYGESPSSLKPEIHLVEVEYDGAKWIQLPNARTWEWQRSLVGINSSQSSDSHYTLEDGTWDRVVGYWRSGKEFVHTDYASSEGYTIRFGDNEFGITPAKQTIFQVTYRLGNGQQTNVASDTITYFDPTFTFIESVTNPLPADRGRDPETLDEVRQVAPQAFRYKPLRAVRTEDYSEIAERLEWVQRAGSEFRWTGSWLSLFCTPDPRNSVEISTNQQGELSNQLNRVRQAGREVHVTNPQYADLDLMITLCAKSSAHAGEVEGAVNIALLGSKGTDPQPGFFSSDNFTFGSPLELSVLEREIKNVPGVLTVESIYIRRRGYFDWRLLSEYSFKVEANHVIRVENNPLHPEYGTIRLTVKGGA